MGKKNKKNQQQNNGKVETSIKPQGGSVILKNKDVKKEKNPETTPVPKLAPAAASPQKVVEGTKKKKKRGGKKNKQNGAENEAKPQVPKAEPMDENGDNEEKKAPANGKVKLTKKMKQRLTSELKKEIILNPKSNNKSLGDLKTVDRKITKLKSKEGTPSLKAQRKIALLEQLHDKLSKGQKPAENAPKEKPPQKKEKSEVDSLISVYVKNLKPETTKEMIEAHFSSVTGYLSVFLPFNEKKKRYAFVNFSTQEGREEAMKMSNTSINGNEILVRQAVRKNKGKNNKKKSQPYTPPGKGKKDKKKATKKAAEN